MARTVRRSAAHLAEEITPPVDERFGADFDAAAAKTFTPNAAPSVETDTTTHRKPRIGKPLMAGEHGVTLSWRMPVTFRNRIRERIKKESLDGGAFEEFEVTPTIQDVARWIVSAACEDPELFVKLALKGRKHSA